MKNAQNQNDIDETTKMDKTSMYTSCSLYRIVYNIIHIQNRSLQIDNPNNFVMSTM